MSEYETDTEPTKGSTLPLFKAIEFSVMKKETLFLHKNTNHTFLCKKITSFLGIHFLLSSTTSVFYHLRGQTCLLLKWPFVYIKNPKQNNSIMYGF